MKSPSKSHDRAADKKGFSVALPKALLKEIEKIAAQETRTRNAQIEHLLKHAVESWKWSKLVPQDEEYSLTPALDLMREKAAGRADKKAPTAPPQQPLGRRT